MSVSLKCQYGLRALFELARRAGNGPTRIQEIAEAQAIPPRFLENILNQLRRGGFVESRRGKAGGFVLARPAGQRRRIATRCGAGLRGRRQQRDRDFPPLHRPPAHAPDRRRGRR